MNGSNIKEGLSAIAREVLDDVLREADAIIVASEKDAKQTLGAAKEEADRSYQTKINEAIAKAEGEKRKITSLAEVEARNLVLQTKEKLVNSAFEKAKTQLEAFTKTKEYHEYLLTLIEKTVKKMGSKRLIVHLNAKDKAWLTKGRMDELSKKAGFELTMSDDLEPVIGGCRIQTADGKIVSDNTLENRLQELKPTLRVEVARILFGKEG